MITGSVKDAKRRVKTMVDIAYDEFADVDGLEYLSATRATIWNEETGWHMLNIPNGYELCEHCDGTGYCECDDDLGVCKLVDCCDCGGDTYFPQFDLIGWCVADGCEKATVNKSHGEHLCTEHDESRHVEIKNYPDRYERRLL